tara:strand:+ start:1247 stop:2170 length:924 start_codon:yes stop_codon:yes gene_type:complete
MALSDYFSTPVNKSTGKPFTTKEVSDAFATSQDVSASKKKSVAAGEATGGAYVYKGKGAANRGEFKVKLSSEVKAEAEALGIDLPGRGYQGNRSSVAAIANKFNDEMEAARNDKAEVEASAAEAPAVATDAFDINVGEEVVVAADPGEYGLGGNEVEAVGGDEAAVGLNTAANFDEVVTSAGNAADNSATNTLMTGAFDNDYTAGTETVAAALTDGASAADAIADTPIDTGQTSAISGIVDQALAAENSTGAAEDEAIGDYGSGTRGTIMTSPQGLLNDESDVFSTANLEEDPFLRPNRSLGGGLLY